MTAMPQIEFGRFNPRVSPELIDPLVECYREVFSALPWSEWKKCAVCGNKWGIESESELARIQFQHCGSTLCDYWPADEVRHDILHELDGSASCWLAMQGDKIVGFCWGYEVSAEQIETKLKLVGLADRLHAQFGSDARYAYQDEMGVIADLRGHRIASKMFEYRLADFRFQGLTVGVVRTKTLPPSVTHRWFTRPDYSYQVVGEYNDADGRVVLARKLDDLQTTATVEEETSCQSAR